MTELSVVVVLYRTDPDLVRRCIGSVRAATTAGISVEVVVVDNSGNAKLDGLRHLADAWVAPPNNLGFASACNLGMAQATSPYVLFLNPDARLETQSLIALIAAASARPRALFCGWLRQGASVQVDAYLRWWSSSGRLIRRRGYGRYLESEAKQEKLVPVEKVSGGALFAPRSLLATLGPFDERFFLYGEDVDLSERAKARGIGLYAVPAAPVEHEASSSMVAHSALVEAARADAAIRLNAYHLPYGLALLTRVEFALVTIAGLLPGLARSSRTRSARLARFGEIRRWGIWPDRPKFVPR